MINSIKNYCEELIKEFDSIPAERKQLLIKISDYIKQKVLANKPAKLMYVCTHNSRRSHFGQIWAKVAANYFKIKNVETFSGGTEVTAFNTNAINALRRIGFKISSVGVGDNPFYKVVFDDREDPIVCFSKVYNHSSNPSKEFAAIMTCSDAEENCPFIPGVELRIGTTYNDPKEFDNTPLQDEKYDERCKQIALETFFLFSNI